MPGAGNLIASDRVLVIAHRGNSRVAPENTLPAFESALEQGVDFVELDIQQTVDGHLVVIHDETLPRTTDAATRWDSANRCVQDCTLAELRTLEAGSWFAPQYAGTKIPTLNEALNLVLPRSMLMIERKTGDVDKVLRVLHEHRAINRVALHAFDWQFLSDAYRREPGLVLGALGEKVLSAAFCEQARKIGATILGWEAAYLTSETIAAAHARGLRVWAWTVDDLAEARRLLAAGINGLISNVPKTIQTCAREFMGGQPEK